MNLFDELVKPREELVEATNVANYTESPGEDTVNGSQDVRVACKGEVTSVSEAVVDIADWIYKYYGVEVAKVDVARLCLAILECVTTELVMDSEIASRLHHDKDAAVMLKAKQLTEANMDKVFEYIKTASKSEKGSQSSGLTMDMYFPVGRLVNDKLSGVDNVVDDLIEEYSGTPQSVLDEIGCNGEKKVEYSRFDRSYYITLDDLEKESSPQNLFASVQSDLFESALQSELASAQAELAAALGFPK